MVHSLATLHAALAKDPGLKAALPSGQISRGLAAADRLSDMLVRLITAKHLNDDGLITATDMAVISHTVRYTSKDYWAFIDDHGDDEGDAETGYHLLQNDGGTLMFQGRKLVDTIGDAIFHYGFKINPDGRFENEDGDDNELASDVAGWLNYFLNGKNVVHGGARGEELYSGSYSAAVAKAADETFLAGAGQDSIWAGDGNDMVWAGLGHDKSGGDAGNDTLHGEAGNDSLGGGDGRDVLTGDAGSDVLGGGAGADQVAGGFGADTLYGETGADTLTGEDGADVLYAGSEADRLTGGRGNDVLGGDEGSDTLNGDDGADKLHGGDGADLLRGGNGADTLAGGEQRDRIWAGAGADEINLWESVQTADTLVFRAGDSGKTRATIDHVEGFKSGVDKIDLSSFAGMVYEDLDYRGGGKASCYFDGRHLRVDGNGDAVTDMIIEFKWQDKLVAGDFIFA